MLRLSLWLNKQVGGNVETLILEIKIYSTSNPAAILSFIFLPKILFLIVILLFFIFLHQTLQSLGAALSGLEDS